MASSRSPSTSITNASANRASTLFQTQINRFDPNIGAGPGFDQVSNTLDDQSLRTIGFIPDTDRTTGSVRLNTRIGKRAVIHGGLQISELDQEGDRTPSRSIAGLRDNKVRFYSGNLAFDLKLADALSVDAFYKFDHRSNKLPTRHRISSTGPTGPRSTLSSRASADSGRAPSSSIASCA